MFLPRPKVSQVSRFCNRLRSRRAGCRPRLGAPIERISAIAPPALSLVEAACRNTVCLPGDSVKTLRRELVRHQKTFLNSRLIFCRYDSLDPSCNPRRRQEQDCLSYRYRSQIFWLAHAVQPFRRVNDLWSRNFIARQEFLAR